MKLYQRIASYALIGLGSLGLFGCDKNNDNQNVREPSRLEQQVQTENQFNPHYVGKFDHGLSYAKIQMRLGDMDGDGDLDIVLMDAEGNLFVYENTLPQNNQ